MRYLLTSDIHVRLETLALSEKFFQFLIAKAKELSVDQIIILGDLFHTKAIIRGEALNLCLEYLPRYNFAILVGNHDRFNEQFEPHALEALKKITLIIDSPLEGTEFTFIPYYPKEEFIKCVENCSSKYLFCHQGFQGFFMNNFKTDTEGIDPSILKKFKHVFSGHYHKPYTRDNLTYIGSPFQQKFDEMGQDKRVILFDSDREEIQYIPVEGFPRYQVFDVDVNQIVTKDKELKQNFHEIVEENDIVKIRIIGLKEEVKKIDKETISRFFKFSGNLKIEPKYTNSSNYSTIDETLNYNKMFETWLNLQDTKLDKDKILKKALNYIDPLPF